MTAQDIGVSRRSRPRNAAQVSDDRESTKLKVRNVQSPQRNPPARLRRNARAHALKKTRRCVALRLLRPFLPASRGAIALTIAPRNRDGLLPLAVLQEVVTFFDRL